MSILGALFGSREDEEKQAIELWKRVKNMPREQLIDVCKYNPNTTHGRLGLILLYKTSRSDAEALDRDGFHLGLLSNMMTKPLVLLGVGEEFDEIRRLLKDALRVLNPDGTY